MALYVPLPLIDDFLLNYTAGQAVLVLFVLVVLASLPLKSRKILSLNLVLFGIIFMVTPGMLAAVEFRLLGVVLLVLGPLLYVTARR